VSSQIDARLDPANHDWMTARETASVFEALRTAGGEARFVGGAVRNALLGQRVTDIDIATTLSPASAMSALKTASIDTVPTGIEHGTITAIVKGHPFEVTSLRRDVSTDGRRAIVTFTNDWAEDAARRDFTMNAIYADETGCLFDPTGGIADLRAGVVSFVGDPDARIQEDYLRILRFFRFQAWYGKAAPDETALEASARNKAGLKRLSSERVQKELLRLLEAEDPEPALKAMQRFDILEEILPAPLNLERLSRIIAIAKQSNIPRCAVVSLAALLPSEEAANTVASNLKLSNAHRAQLVGILSDYRKVTPMLSSQDVGKLLYRCGKKMFSEMMLLSWADAQGEPAWNAVLARANDWIPPVFPINGREVMDGGVEEGPGVGRVLSDLERWWVENEFMPNHEALLAKLKKLVG